MEVFNPGRDEVVGLGDGLLRNDQTLIYTRGYWERNYRGCAIGFGRSLRNRLD